MANSDCLQCGSSRVLRDAELLDKGQHSNGITEIHLGFRDPDALLLKGSIRARVFADVCADCGFVALRVDDTASIAEALTHKR